MTHDELNALVAGIAGWTAMTEQRGDYTLAIVIRPGEKPPFDHWDKDRMARDQKRYAPISNKAAVKLGFFGIGFPDYHRDANAVIELLELDKFVDIARCFSLKNGLVDEKLPIMWKVRLGEEGQFIGKASTFCRAACLALLKAHGCEVGE